MNSRCSPIGTLLVALVLSTSTVTAQDINVDLYDHYAVPGADYGAAGQPGVWNMAPGGNHATPPQILNDTFGNATAATISYPLSFLGTATGWIDEGPATGDDESLVEDGFWVTDIPERIRFQNLIDGSYVVIAYGIITNNAGARTSITAGGEWQTVGGAWTGTFEVGVTHALFDVEVTDGRIDVDWVTGSVAGIGFLSGIQLDYQDVTGVPPNGHTLRRSTWSRVKQLYE